MKIREWLNKNSAFVTIGAVLVLCICMYHLVAVASGSNAPKPIKDAWYYDLETSKLFIGPNASLPPIPTPSGHKDPNGNDLGVRAVIFSCGKCGDESKRYIGYLETMTPEAREQMKAMMEAASTPNKEGAPPPPMITPGNDPMINGRLIADPTKSEWLTMDSPDSGRLIQASMSKCGDGKYPTQCFPNVP